MLFENFGFPAASGLMNRDTKALPGLGIGLHISPAERAVLGHAINMNSHHSVPVKFIDAFFIIQGRQQDTSYHLQGASLEQQQQQHQVELCSI